MISGADSDSGDDPRPYLADDLPNGVDASLDPIDG